MCLIPEMWVDLASLEFGIVCKLRLSIALFLSSLSPP